MAGKPHSANVVSAIAKEAEQAGVTPLEYVCNRIAGGDYLSTIAAELNLSRALLSTYVNALPDAKAKLKEARSEGAHAMYETALAAWDATKLLTKEDIAIAKGKSDTLLWGAQRLGRTEFGEDKQQINVNVNNIGSLSLDAMRARVLDNVTHARARLIEAGPEQPNVLESDTPKSEIVLSDDSTTT